MALYSNHCPKLPWMVDFHSTAEGTIPNSQLQAAFAENFTEHLAVLNVRSEVSKRRLTGIICTIGPSCCDESTLESMMDAGMTVARLKMCYFDHEECKNTIHLIRKTADNYSKKIGRVYPLAIGLDIRGPEIRTGVLKDPNVQEIELVEGNKINITTDPAYEEHVSEDMIYVDYQRISEVVEPGDQLYIDNGEIRLSALEIVGSIIRCIIEEAGKLHSHASLSLPGVPIDLPVITEKDMEDLKFSIKYKVDAVFFAGLRNEESLQYAKYLLGEEGKHILVISKIDNSQALDNVDRIIKESDGILIDRKTLGVELPLEKLFIAQKFVTAKCNKAGKLVICSTQTTESAKSNKRLSKLEASDIGNAILDGTDCILLSKETSVGEYPVDAITNLSSVCKEAEAAVYQKQVFTDLTEKFLSPIEPIYAVSISVIEASLKCNAAAIIVLTTTGRSAKILASYRSRCPIIAITRFGHVARQLHFYRAVEPIHYIKPQKGKWEQDLEERIQFGITWGKLSGFIRAGDAVIIASGNRCGAGFTNSMKVLYASEFDTIKKDTD